jgi:DUF971 family protein
MTFMLTPRSIRRDGDTLCITWSDGVATRVTWRALRAACPCATCLEERKAPPNPFKILSEREVAAGAPAPVTMKPVGHYAYQIQWNDGHSGGIYTLDSLRTLSTPETNS